MAYLMVRVGGNPQFGGYLSIDGASSFLLTDDMTYELSNGPHHMEIFTTSDAQRKLGKGQRIFNNIVGTDGFIGAISEAQAENSLGESWSIQVHAEEDEVVYLEIVSNGRSIMSAPQYRVIQLEEDFLEELRTEFAQIEEKKIQEKIQAEQERKLREERRKNTPRRSIPKIIVGAILSFYSFCGLFAVAIGASSGNISPVFILIPLIPLVIFLIMMFDGMKRKLR